MNGKRTRQAVALEYGKRSVPAMTAKGDGELAELIIEQAKKAGHTHCRRSAISGAAVSA